MREFVIKRIALLFGLGVLLCGIGCSPIKIHHDFDKAADFRSFTAYDWLENRHGYTGRVGAMSETDVAIDTIVRTAVMTELDGMGYKHDTDNPDVILIYHIGTGEQIDVSAWGYQYGQAYWGWHGRGADVYTYQEGALIVDLIDGDNMTLVWRGTAQSTIDDPPTVDNAKKTIPEAVSKMFKGYPPAQ